ncbi:MAG TPA: methyltransferase domain-containing protein [Vicinamibacterales bacterium]|nr:methyltransferase domain-containing protein [Vicinamibacterales bacterium]
MSASTIAVIQANHTDLLPDDTRPDHYVVAKLRESRRIDRIVIAAPATPANRALEPIAAAWGVDLFLGSEYDVVERLLGAAEFVGAAPDAALARVLMNRFYLDAALVDRQIDLLRASRADFVSLPYDFDINFGADVLTVDCLRRADRAIAGPGHEHERFRPWLFIEDHPDLFTVVTCDDVPSYPRAVLDGIRASGLFAERDCGTCSTFTYDLIAASLSPSDVVLDIASGSGEGTAMLAAKCRQVVGCDLDGGVIAEARARGIPNATFEVQDGCALSYPDAFFSAIVSSNTLEHVADDEAMLRSFHRVLRPGGRLILETPLLRKRPFNFPLLSSHLREYDKDDLIRLMERCGFRVERKLGMNRGMYLEWDRAREAVLVHVLKTS